MCEAIAVKTMGHQFHNGHQQDRILKWFINSSKRNDELLLENKLEQEEWNLQKSMDLFKDNESGSDKYMENNDLGQQWY